MKNNFIGSLFTFLAIWVWILVPVSCNKTQDQKIIPSGSIADIDGNIYKTVQIGDQEWMAENLKVSHFRNGDAIEYFSGSSDWTKCKNGACCNYNNHPGNDITFGKLYNGLAVTDSRNIAPEGWHIPSDEEWVKMIDFIGGYSVAGGKLKAVDNISWIDPNVGATDEFGFKALPGGYCTFFSSFYEEYYSGLWWSSTFSKDSYLYGFMVNSNSERILKGSWYNKYGLSVRCVKDH